MKLIRFLAILTIIIGFIACAITYSVDPFSPYSTAWQITFLTCPIGAILSVILISKGVKYGLLLLLLNLCFNFGTLWFVTDFINMLTGK